MDRPGEETKTIHPGWVWNGGPGQAADGICHGVAAWNPWRAAFGAYAFGALRRVILDIQGPQLLLGLRNPFFFNPYYGFFLQMLPFLFVIFVLIIGSREAVRKRMGAPAALGLPYVRGERGL